MTTASGEASRWGVRNGLGLALVPVPVILLVVYFATYGRHYGLDLQVYRDAAGSWWHGRNPYSEVFTRSGLPFTYPPFALAVLVPLSWISFGLAHWLNLAVSVAAATAGVVYVLADSEWDRNARLWLGSLGWVCVAAFALEPARSGIDYGQIEFVLMAVVVIDVMAMPSSLRGLGVGVAAAIKLTPLVYLLYFVVARDRKATVRAIVTCGVATGAMWLVDPGLSRVFWTVDVSQPGRTGPVTYPSNQNWYAIVHRPPFPTTGSPVAWALLCTLTVAVGAWVAWRSAATGRRAWSLLAVAFTGLLVSPISWSHHWVWILLLPPMLISSLRLAVPRPVRVMLWGIVGIAAAGPYWWFDAGGLADTLQALLPIWTFAMLVVWGIHEFRSRARSVDLAAVTR